MTKHRAYKYKLGNLFSRIISNLLKIAVTLFFAFPFYWMVITSIKTFSESVQYPPTLWPHTFNLNAYKSLLRGFSGTPYLKNSVIIIVCVMVIQVLVMVPASYAFARYKFKGSGLMFGLVTISLMTPVEVTFLSVYLMFSKVGLIKTLLPQILPFGANAFGIFLLRQAFKQVPEELIESACLDNAGEFKILTKIMLPMAKSTFVTVVMLAFITQWNEYFWPLVMTTTNSVQPITMLISQFSGGGRTAMAANCLLILPEFVLFLFASKRITSAMTYRGVK